MHPRTILTAALLGFAGLAAAALGLLVERGGFNFPTAAAIVLAPGSLLAWLLADQLEAARRVSRSQPPRTAEAPGSLPREAPRLSVPETAGVLPAIPGRSEAGAVAESADAGLAGEKAEPAAETGDLLEFERGERKRLERELRQAELRFRSATHFAPNGVIAADQHGTIQWWNDEAAKLFGYPAEEAAGKDLGELIAPGEREHYHEEMLRFVETGESTVSNKWMELMGRRKDGAEFPMEVYLQSWATTETAFLGLIVHDLSRRRQFEETLRRETARVELMQRVAAAANEAASIEEALQASIDLVCSYSDWAVGHVYLIDLHGQLAPTNIWHLKSREWFEEFRDTTVRLGAASPDNLAGRVAAAKGPVWIEDLARESVPRNKAAAEVGLETAFAFPVSVSNELRAVCEFFSTRARAPDESLFGLATYIGGQIGRVIERKWAEAALQDSDAKFRDLFDEAPVGYYELDAGGIIRRVNRTELQMLGFSAEEMLGKPVWEFMEEAGARPQVEARLAGAVPLTIREQTYRCRDGGTIPVLAHERLIRDPQENSPGILGTIQNISERKRSEQALRSSEERNRTLLASLPQHVFFKNSDLRFETVNALFAASFGKGPEEIIGKTDYDLFPADLAEKYRADDLQVMETRIGLTTVEMNQVQGQERFVETSKSPVVDSHGKVLGVLGLFTDITERKKAEEFRNRLAAIVESSRDAIISQSPDGTITSWNVGAQAIYGHGPEEVIGRPFSILIPPDMLESETRFHAKVREGDRVQNIETIHLRKDGARIHVSLTVSPIVDAAGAVTGGSMVARDVTEMKEAEEEINRARTLLQSVVEALPLMVFMKSAADLRYVLVNRAAQDLIGFSEEEIVGKTDQDLFPHEQADVFAGQDREALASGRLVESEQTIQTRHKGARFWHTRKIPILGGFGKPQHLLGICEDITERKLAEEKLKLYAFRLEQSNRALQDFASVASHDLQEPLRKVQAFGDRLKTKFAAHLTDEGCDYLQRMQGAAQRMQKLIEDLLAFSRVTSKAQPFVTVDLNEVARDVLLDLEVRIEQKKAKVELGRLPVVEADPTQMRQLLQNLTVNALKFQTPGTIPRVKIYSRRVPAKLSAPSPLQPASERYEIVVEDNGIGFDEKYLDKIFTVFQRLHSRQEYEGTGVGLAICQKIAERHHGQITAQSELGKGARFMVTLPARQIES